MLDISKLVRKDFGVSNYMVQIDDALVAKKPLQILFPLRFNQCGLADISDEIRCISIFAIVNEKGEYMVSNVASMMHLTPDTTTIQKHNDEEFYIFARTKGQTIKSDLEERFSELEKLSVGEFKKELTKIKTQATKIARAKISTGESSLFEIDSKEDGKNVTYKLTPEQAKERIKLNEEYIKTEGKKDLQSYIDDYVTFDKMPIKKATERAMLDVKKDANTNSANVLLDRLDAGKIKIEIKE